MVGDRSRHVYLVRSWSLVSRGCRHSELVPQVEHPGVGLVDVVRQDGAGLCLGPAVEVAGHVLRDGAVLPAVPLEASRGPLQGISKLEGPVGRGLALGLRRVIRSVSR